MATEQQEPQPAQLISDSLRRITTDERSMEQFEVRLSDAKLIPLLEETGILPQIKDPNPYKIEADRQMHNLWWYNHDEELRQHGNILKERKRTIQHLFAGAIIARDFGDQLFPSHPQLKDLKELDKTALGFEERLKNADLIPVLEDSAVLPPSQTPENDENILIARERIIQLLFAGGVLVKNFNDQLFSPPPRRFGFVTFTPPMPEKENTPRKAKLRRHPSAAWVSTLPVPKNKIREAINRQLKKGLITQEEAERELKDLEDNYHEDE